jgi:hypothetical protein
MGRYIPDEVPGHFWDIIDRCGGDKERLREILAEFPQHEAQRFCWNFEEAREQIATLYVDFASFSEDTLRDICSWVVTQGEDAFVTVWDEAEDVVIDPNSPYGQIQRDPGLLGVAMEVYQARFGEPVPAKTHDRFVE